MENYTFYVAGPWADREHVREIITKIQAAGWGTCSRWADKDNPDIAADDPDRADKLKFQAARDVEDVVKADGLIYVNSSISEGKSTELGISLAMLKPIIIIGQRSYPERSNNNIFLNLSIPCYPTIEEALEWLNGEGQLYLSFAEDKQFEHMEKTIAIYQRMEASEEMEFPSE